MFLNQTYLFVAKARRLVNSNDTNYSTRKKNNRVIMYISVLFTDSISNVSVTVMVLSSVVIIFPYRYSVLVLVINNNLEEEYSLILISKI